MDEKSIKEVFSDEVFVKYLLELDTPAQVQAALSAKDIEMIETEIIALRDEIVRLLDKLQSGEELSVDQLDDVAGGVLLSGAIVAGLVTAGLLLSAGGAISTGLGIGLGALIGSRRW